MKSPAAHLLRASIIVFTLLLIVVVVPARADITMQPALKAEMSDGVSLATDEYLPDETGTYPVVFTRSPYNKRQFKTYLAEPFARAGSAGLPLSGAAIWCRHLVPPSGTASGNRRSP